jgi:hypothetical protein
MDQHGCRLRYLHNELLCYVVSLRWHRVPFQGQFPRGHLITPSAHTVSVSRQIALLDARLTGRPGPRYYRTEAFRRPLRYDVVPVGWDSVQWARGWNIRIDPEDLHRRHWPAYDLPGVPSWLEYLRVRRTEDWLRGLPPAYRVIDFRAPAPIREEKRVHAGR